MKKLLLLLLLVSSPCFAAGNDSNCKLLLHQDTNFTDSSASAHAITNVNAATIDNISPKFGAGDGVFTAALNQYLTGTTSSDYAFGTGDFTIDTWVRFTTSPSSDTITTLESTSAGVDITLTANTNVRSFIVGTQYNWTVTALNTLQWYHFAMVRSGSTLRFYVDGVNQGDKSDSSNITNSNGIWIANRSDVGSPLHGQLDEFRVSNSARWTSDFTPPTSAYSSGGTSVDLAMLGVG